MKQLTLLLIALLSAQLAMAQRKHSFSIGLQYVQYAPASEWRGVDNVYVSDNNQGLRDNIGLWGAYELKNRYAVRMQTNRIEQEAYYAPRKGEFYDIYSRSARFHDLTLGYNVGRHLPRCLRNVSLWIYGGAGITGLDINRISPVSSGYTTMRQRNGDLTGWPEGEGYDSRGYPTAQFLIKYSPIRHVFVGLGGDYRQVSSQFKPVSGSVTIGYQL